MSRDKINREGNERYNQDYIKWKKWGAVAIKVSDMEYYKGEVERILINPNEELKVLEIGFGGGSFLDFCKMKKWDVEGIEINEELIKSAKNKGFKVFNSCRLDGYVDNTFDLVVAFDVIEHFNADKTIEILKIIKKVLKPQGVFIMRFPNGDSPNGLRIQNGDITHMQAIGSEKIQYYSKVAEMELVRLAGAFEVIWCRDLRKLLYGIIVIPLRNIIDLFVKYVYFKGLEVNYTSENLVAVMRKIK